jgi:hypothetical protein
MLSDVHYRDANNVAANGAASASNVVGVSLGELRYEDWFSGERSVVSFPDPASCSTTFYPSADKPVIALNGSVCFFAQEASRALLLSSEAVCSDLVKELHYTVLHDTNAAATILSVVADVVITDVPFDSKASLGVAMSQAFAVSFQSNKSAAASAANGNLVTRQRSGNPGYLMGMPVLYGVLNGSVMAELVQGFTLPIPSASMMCPTSIEGLDATAVAFGYDSITGCNLRFTRQQLKDFCCQGAGSACLDGAFTSDLQPSAFASSSGQPYFLNFKTGYVGIYGDADPLDSKQWLAMSYSAPVDERKWNDRTSTCSNIFSGTAAPTLCCIIRFDYLSCLDRFASAVPRELFR